MLTYRQILHIHELARLGFSQRAISDRTGHARTTIARVLAGTPPRAACAVQPRRCGPQRSPRKNYVRCGGCGRLVTLPCLACRIEEAAARRRLFPRAA
jgi:hypothetical protein